MHPSDRCGTLRTLRKTRGIEVTQSPHRGRSFFSGVVLLQTALLLASAVMVPGDGRRPGSACSGCGAGRPAVRRGEPGAIASTRAGAIGRARPEAVRRARTRAVGNARGDARGEPHPLPSNPVAPSASPDGSPSTSPGTSASASPEPSPSDSVDSPTPTAPAGPPAVKERNRVTVVAAADIDGNGKLDDPVTIESPPGTILRNVHAVPVPTDPAPPAGIFFPAGLFDYEVVVAKPGDPATVTFHLPDGTVKKDVDTGFWVLQNGRWSDLTARADADHVTDKVTVKLVDGGAGDEDRHADGVIADPGGPGVPGDGLDPHAHRPGSGRPHGDLQLLPRGMHRDERDHADARPRPRASGWIGSPWMAPPCPGRRSRR